MSAQKFDISGNIRRFTFSWDILVINEAPVSIFVVTTEVGVILIDCGHQSFRQQVKNILPPKIDYLLITHSHVDHIGNLDLISEMFPDAKILIHEREYDLGIPTLSGNLRIFPKSKYRDIKGDAMIYNIPRFLHLLEEISWKPFILKNKVLVFNDSGEFKDNDIPVQLNITKYIKIVNTKGHTPGHSSFHICEENILIVGDALTNVFPNPLKCRKLTQSAKLGTPIPMSTSNMSDAKSSIVRLDNYAKTNNIKMLYPSHDNCNGVTASQLDVFAKTLIK